MKVLLTGFGAFGQNTTNPTEQIVQEFTTNLANVSIDKHVFDVDFELVQKDYPAILENSQANLIINLGLNASGSAVQLEQFALNTGFDPYGERQHFPIIDNGSAAYQSNINLDTLAQELCRAGIPTLRSNHAGAYLCNFILYHSLHWATNNQAKALFVHIPYTTDLVAELCAKQKRTYPSLPQSYIHQVIEHTIRFVKESIIS